MAEDVPLPVFVATWLNEQALSLRAYRALEKLGVEKPGQLEGLTVNKLLRLPNVGRKTVAEVARLMLKHGYRMELPVWIERLMGPSSDG